MAATISIALVALDSTPALYPCSPLAEFPPPFPSLCPPPRQRVNLTIKTNFNDPPPASIWSQKGALQPHRNNLPRRRKVVRRVVVEQPNEEPSAPAVMAADTKLAGQPPATNATSVSPAPIVDDPCLQELVPGLLVAFATEYPDAPTTKPHTHLVDIRHYTWSGPKPGSAVQTEDGGITRLCLTLPAATSSTGRAALALNDTQLRAGRDFIMNMIPYSTTKPLDGVPEVRIVVRTPRGRPTDAMALTGCYLATVSKLPVETVLRYMDDEPDFLSAWKGEVSGDEIEQVEKIARMRSWASCIRR